jgi:putative copper export protein
MTYYTVLNFFHYLALTVWIGGIVYTNLILFPSLQVLDPPQRNKFMGTAAARFSRLAWTAVIVLVLTGLLKFPHHSPFEDMAYGITLSTKLALVLIMIVIGLWVTFGINPKAQSLAPAPGDPPSPEFVNLQKKLATLIFVNMILGIIVLFLASML